MDWILLIRYRIVSRETDYLFLGYETNLPQVQLLINGVFAQPHCDAAIRVTLFPAIPQRLFEYRSILYRTFVLFL